MFTDFEFKQEMLHILTITDREVMHTYIYNLKYSNTDIKQNYFPKKFWLFYEVSFTLFWGIKTFRLYLWFTMREFVFQ